MPPVIFLSHTRCNSRGPVVFYARGPRLLGVNQHISRRPSARSAPRALHTRRSMCRKHKRVTVVASDWACAIERTTLPPEETEKVYELIEAHKSLTGILADRIYGNGVRQLNR
jgi:hypothetical protein